MRVTFEKAYEKYKAYMIRCNFSDRTIGNKADVLSLFCGWLLKARPEALQDFRAVSCEDVLDYMDSLYLRDLQPSSVKIYMTDLRCFFGFLYKNDMIESDPTRKVPVIKVPKKEVVYIPHDEIMGTLDSMLLNPAKKKGCDYKTAVRDYFMIRTAYVSGWRASESLGCDPSKDIDWDTGEVYLPRRKGGKDGRVYFDMETTRMLKEWYFSNYPNGKRLWYGVRGKYKGRPLSSMGYYLVFRKFFSKGSHRLRASFATHLITKGVGIKDVADLLGHESVASTVKYAAVVRTRIREIHAQKNPFSV